MDTLPLLRPPGVLRRRLGFEPFLVVALLRLLRLHPRLSHNNVVHRTWGSKWWAEVERGSLIGADHEERSSAHIATTDATTDSTASSAARCESGARSSARRDNTSYTVVHTRIVRYTWLYVDMLFVL